MHRCAFSCDAQGDIQLEHCTELSSPGRPSKVVVVEAFESEFPERSSPRKRLVKEDRQKRCFQPM